MTEQAPAAEPEWRSNLRTWGRWVRLLRTARGMTQEQLGAAAGIDKNAIGAIERGDRNIGVAYVWPLARALGVRPADLFRVGEAGDDEQLLRRLLRD